MSLREDLYGIMIGTIGWLRFIVVIERFEYMQFGTEDTAYSLDQLLSNLDC